MEYYQFLRKHVGHEPIILPGSVGIILNDQHEILLEKRRNGHYGLPGGFMDLGESFEETLIREVKEETGLSVEECIFERVNSGKKHHVVLENGDEIYVITAVFHVTKYHGTLTIDPEESLDLGYFSLDALPDPMNTAHLKIIQDFNEGS